MCGIIGYVGPKPPVEVLLAGLRRLEYRGYDSAGVATVHNGKLQLLRSQGKLDNLERQVAANPLEGTYGLQTAKSLPYLLRRVSLFFGLAIGPVLAVSSALLASNWQMMVRMSFPSLLLGCAFVIAAVWVMMHGGWKKELGRRILILVFFLYGCLRLTTFVVTSSRLIEETRFIWVFFAHNFQL